MSLTTTYVVVPFKRSGGRMQPGQAQQHKTEAKAKFAAERLLGSHPGAIILEQIGDASLDIWQEPRLIQSYGQVPEEALMALAA